MTEVGFCLVTSISFSWASGVTCSITAHPFPLGKSWWAAAFFDTGWPGVTPYLRFLALPHQQPPKVTACSMFWTNFATLFPLRAGTQIGHPLSQKSGSFGCRIGIFHPLHPYFFSGMITLLRIQLSEIKE
jgi:hypothetical protein